MSETTKQRCLKMLTQNGMFESQAEAVLEQAKPQIEGDGYSMTWDSSADDYPAPMYAVINLILRREALNWIDTNLPKAWFRPMFTPDPEAEIARLTAASATDAVVAA